MFLFGKDASVNGEVVRRQTTLNTRRSLLFRRTSAVLASWQLATNAKIAATIAIASSVRTPLL
jgi:hypothetical protein